ncbi:hypothetical protein KI387_015834 [Taxus chinensis]|uniref:F-box domain-containing protein n=1 Tax=Taxus chinensis TaxID=29808 RepID=A0AA38GGN9_TAXCH|nr:hypothetical protein KI387_015834 [Taxus chinensis]
MEICVEEDKVDVEEIILGQFGGGLEISAKKEIPEHVMEIILAQIPLDSVARFCTVCKDWNALLSSPKFFDLRNQISNNHPWLIISYDDRCLSYNFSARRWKILNFKPHGPHKYEASSGGLLLLRFLGRREFRVCNPLKPGINKHVNTFSCTHLVSGIVREKESCKVVITYGNTSLTTIHTKISVYDPLENSRVYAGYLTDCHVLEPIVFSKGMFFFLSYEPRLGVRVYSLHDDDDDRDMCLGFVPLPLNLKLNVDRTLGNYDATNCGLAVCGSRVIVATPKTKQGKGIRVWELEFDKSTAVSSWRRIATMPPSMYKHFNSRSWNWDFKLNGVGNYLCFISSQNFLTHVIVYNLEQDSWDWLPQHRPEFIPLKKIGRFKTFAFEPRTF